MYHGWDLRGFVWPPNIDFSCITIDRVVQICLTSKHWLLVHHVRQCFGPSLIARLTFFLVGPCRAVPAPLQLSTSWCAKRCFWDIWTWSGPRSEWGLWWTRNRTCAGALRAGVIVTIIVSGSGNIRYPELKPRLFAVPKHAMQDLASDGAELHLLRKGGRDPQAVFWLIIDQTVLFEHWQWSCGQACW